MKQASGEELIAISTTLALALAKCMDNEEITVFCELMGLLKHDLEIIRVRRFLNKKEGGIRVP